MSLDFLKLHFSMKYYRSCESVLRVKVQKKKSAFGGLRGWLVASGMKIYQQVIQNFMGFPAMYLDGP